MRARCAHNFVRDQVTRKNVKDLYDIQVLDWLAPGMKDGPLFSQLLDDFRDGTFPTSYVNRAADDLADLCRFEHEHIHL
jgi:hypothetical protein